MSSPKRLILAVRNLDEGNKARSELMGARKADFDGDWSAEAGPEQLRISSLVAKSLKGDRVDFAILNAGELRHCVKHLDQIEIPSVATVVDFWIILGVMNGEFITSTDGLESELQINVLSPALLSLLLLPNSTSHLHLPNCPALLHHTWHSCPVAFTLWPSFQNATRPGEILPALNNRAQYSQSDRYSVTKRLDFSDARASK